MLLLVQIVVILALTRAARWLLQPLKQPAVIGEMVAGVLLGPSCLGWLAPNVFAALFPPSSLEPLNVLSQIGLVLFMFLLGRRVSSRTAAANARAIVVVGGVSIVVPFAMGAALATLLHGSLAPSGVGVAPFALFIGTAMSITAFPVLARILIDHGLVETTIGRISIACAAFDDVVGWLGLAAILSLGHPGAPGLLVMRASLLVVYLLGMCFVLRPQLARMARNRQGPLDGSPGGFALVLLVALSSALATQALGVHALFGAFFAGLMMPRSAAGEAGIVDQIEPATTKFLLPLFFALTGLRTNLQLIGGPGVPLMMAAVLITAVVGKGVASAVAARAAGLEWRNAWTIGVLLNTRGLVELVLLNVGLDAGILSPVVFSIFVAMTFVTTFITSPLLHVLTPRASPS